jgi:hypothetical protein
MKPIFHALLIFALASCSSSSGDKKPEPKKKDGSLTSRILMPDRDKRSDFDLARDKTTGKKSGIAGFFQRQSLRGDSFTGKKTFNTDKGFKTAGFSQADLQNRSLSERNRIGGQRYNQADGVAREGSKTFGTGSSSFDDQMATQQGDAFSQSDERFGTSAVRDASRSQRKNVRPLIIKNYQQEGKSAYKEEDVKRMVNRN